jgi:hypothetical protein
MVVHAMIRRVAWYVALVVLTGAVVIGARSRRPAALTPRGDENRTSRALHSDAHLP